MRLIDADALEYHVTENPMVRYEYIHKHEIDTAPTIDAVPVIRCKDCVWYLRSMIKQDGTIDERYKPDWCDLYMRVREETYFCADGERKDDDGQR